MDLTSWRIIFFRSNVVPKSNFVTPVGFMFVSHTLSSFSPLPRGSASEQSYVCVQTIPADFEGTPLAIKAYSMVYQTGDWKEDEVHD